MTPNGISGLLAVATRAGAILLIVLCAGCVSLTGEASESAMPCLSIEIHEQPEAGPGIFHVALYSNGMVEIGFLGNVPDRANLSGDETRRLCSEVSEAASGGNLSPLVAEGQAESRFGNLTYVVLRPQKSEGVAFSPIDANFYLIVDSPIGRALSELDRLLVQRFGPQYCYDEQCRVSRLEFMNIG